MKPLGAATISMITALSVGLLGGLVLFGMNTDRTNPTQIVYRNSSQDAGTPAPALAPAPVAPAATDTTSPAASATSTTTATTPASSGTSTPTPSPSATTATPAGPPVAPSPTGSAATMPCLQDELADRCKTS